MAAPPASLKAIKPYLDRGSEIKARDPIVAYHCRLYALQVRRLDSAQIRLLTATPPVRVSLCRRRCGCGRRCPRRTWFMFSG